tara:strand:- start:561 stop:713 length:153 start_codon:yes stop_codon:yes gene_type:complete
MWRPFSSALVINTRTQTVYLQGEWKKTLYDEIPILPGVFEKLNPEINWSE